MPPVKEPDKRPQVDIMCLEVFGPGRALRYELGEQRLDGELLSIEPADFPTPGPVWMLVYSTGGPVLVSAGTAPFVCQFTRPQDKTTEAPACTPTATPPTC